MAGCEYYIVAIFWNIVDVNIFFKYAENSKKYRKQKHTFISPKKTVDFLTIFDDLNVKEFHLNMSFH